MVAYDFEYFFIKEIYNNGKLTDECKKVPYMMSIAVATLNDEGIENEIKV